MDHWGDPWADNAVAHDTSPAKHEVATPPPTSTQAHAPVLLNGFLDDAQWGNENEAFGGWAESPGKPETRVGGLDGTAGWDDVPQRAEDGLGIRSHDMNMSEDNEWSRIEQDADEFKETDNVVSETSDSATTIQAEDAPAPLTTSLADSIQGDDDLSTRPSTSPSNASHFEPTNESPRTSFEDERAAEKTVVEKEVETTTATVVEDREQMEAQVPREDREEAISPTIQVQRGDVNDDFGDFEQDAVQVIETPLKGTVVEPSLQEACENTLSTPQHEQKLAPHVPAVDQHLLSQLFPPPKTIQELGEAPDDPVHSTSTRKAWYRLTRKQTLREYNSGNDDDDSYIRVTWKTSHIRSEVNNVVARWANEDRLAGRGPGARASFYWDTTAPKNELPFHSRKKSSISVSNPVRPARQAVQPLSTDVPAAFDWSSPSTTAANTLADTALTLRSISSPLAPPKHSTVAKLQRQEGRSISVDLTPRPQQPTSHKRTATAVDLVAKAMPTTITGPVISSPKAQTIDSADPWAGLSALDTNPPPPQRNPTTEDEDDDDWGEMVESPAVSTSQTPTATLTPTTFPSPSTRNNTLPTPSTPASTPKSVQSSPLQPHLMSTGSKNASRIVRLKGTVSPTSSVFKPNALVAGSSERFAIGPGLLKKRDRSAEGTPEKKALQIVSLDEALKGGDNEDTGKVSDDTSTSASGHDIDAFEQPVSEPASTHPLTPSSSPPLPPSYTPPLSANPWSDADLSIFDPPASNTPSQNLPPTSDPWSIFETPDPVSSEPPAPFARPPPRPTTPPAKQPLTSATNSAQKRKMEEDDIIHSIVHGLPYLGYMLRR